MFSESLRILDKNSMDLLIDEAIERAEKAEADLKRAEEEAKMEVDKIEAEYRQEKAKNEKAQQEIAMLKQEIERLKQ